MSFDLHAAALRVLAENGFATTTQPAHAEAAALASHEAIAAPEKGVRDLRDLPWSSVDNAESRDLDQIEAIEKLANGAVKVLVAIADVDALVHRGSAIDTYASTNTTSLYTGTEMFPMLPEELSTNLTSLIAEHARYAVVTEFVVAADGSIDHGDVYRAVVTNHAKLAYDDLGPWLDALGKGELPHGLAHVPEAMVEQVRIQDDVAHRLRAVRVQHGALDIQTIEARPIAKDGKVVDLQVTEQSRSRQLIEELMIAANGVVARWVEAKNRSSLRRVVRTPKRWDRIVALAATYGTTLPAEPDSIALSTFLNARRAADPERFPDVSLSVVKLLGPGEYVLDRPGETQTHFGLAVHDYTHSTAPNRRFADLVTQRIVKAAIDDASPPYTDGELAAIAARCTDREHAAQKVERTMRKVSAALFLHSRIGETFDAIVTGVTPSGTFVRLLTPPAEGRVVRGEHGIDVGDRVRVKLVATEPSRGFIDFVRA